jgi:5-methylcytosine-specific restriction protein A
MQTPIDRARNYIMGKVLTPALQNDSVSKKAKDTIENSVRWLSHFERVGDLIQYLDRFKGGSNSAVFTSLKDAGLLTFEDIRNDFINEFSHWASDTTRLDDFVVGQKYTSFDLAIFSRHYDTRSGGILPIGPPTIPAAVFIKVTLFGGKYRNQWISDDDVLKYYLKSRNDVFDEKYVENAAIIKNPETPVYAFTRNTNEGPFQLVGVFRNAKVHTEQDGSKWFELHNITTSSKQPITEQQLDSDLKRKVDQSSKTSQKNRLARLKLASKKPAEILIVSKAFVRNPDVIAEVLARANGKCEGCFLPAPFIRNSDASPYLEVHHKTPLAEGGEDTVENAVALCANCHRKEHYGPAKWAWTATAVLEKK